MSTSGKPSTDVVSPVTETGTADLVLTGGKVVTLDPRSRISGAVAIAGDRIMAVGSDSELAGLAAGARHIDLAGRTVIPGLPQVRTSRRRRRTTGSDPQETSRK